MHGFENPSTWSIDAWSSFLRGFSHLVSLSTIKEEASQSERLHDKHGELDVVIRHARNVTTPCMERAAHILELIDEKWPASVPQGQ
jgi:hypothetical protein